MNVKSQLKLTGNLLAKVQANPTQTILRTGSTSANDSFLYYTTSHKLNIQVPDEFNGKEIWKSCRLLFE